MKIVHLILTSRFAGSERYAIELANAQSTSHDVSMLLTSKAAQDRPDALARRVAPGVKVVVLDAWKPWLAWQARRVVRGLAPDVAHAHLSAGCKALSGLRGSSLRVATLHIRYKPSQHARLDGLIAIAPWQLESVPAALRAHCVQIDNWSSPPPADATARATIRRSLGIGDDELVFGALGRTEHSKGFDLLLAAFNQAALPGSRLVIAGNGRHWQELRRSAPSCVIMPGFVVSPQDWLAAFDVFVSPARSEPFGLVFLEAMHAGLPVLASASEGASHLADIIGRPLFPIGDVQALAAALRELHRIRPARRSYDLARFDRDRQVSSIEAFYRSELALRDGGRNE